MSIAGITKTHKTKTKRTRLADTFSLRSIRQVSYHHHPPAIVIFPWPPVSEQANPSIVDRLFPPPPPPTRHDMADRTLAHASMNGIMGEAEILTSIQGTSPELQALAPLPYPRHQPHPD